jgi:glucan endo-1,6-beta-glucosidase
MRFAVLTILLWTALVQAWLPADRDLFGNITHEALDSTLAAGQGRTVKRRLPISGKIRGVNLGSMFVMEPWMAGTEWSNMDCGSYRSEYECVRSPGQSKANSACYWGRWITNNDLATISSYGINTIRVPVGYWMDEPSIFESEYFP